jgi:hypothetical protein
VRETSNVNQLEIENLGDDEVFVQAGDIVKGGRQDRTLSVDLVVPPRSGKLAVDAFCVEHGRWTRRGSEPSRQFSESSRYLASKELKLAARQRKQHQDVWNAVSETQRKLRDKAGVEATNPASPSSMQLTMETVAVKTGIQPYLDKLAKVADGERDVVGCAFSVNGKLSSAEVYASPELFQAQWRKLLEAGAVEAFAEAQSAPGTPPDLGSVRTFLDDPPSGKPVEEEIGGRTKLSTVEGADAVVFESRDLAHKDAWLRRSVVGKDSGPKRAEGF